MHLSFLFLLLITALWGCQQSSYPKSGPPEKITVAYTTQPDCALVHIAQAKGYFAAEGLAVQPQLHTYGKAALGAVLAGKADLATVAETPVMFAAFKKEKIFIIANIVSSSKNTAVIARKDRGITQPADMKGKRIGYTPGTTSEFFMDAIFTANGIDRKDALLIGMKPDEMFAALTTGKIDAAITWNFPLIMLRKELGVNGITLFDNDIYTQMFTVTAQQEFVRKNPETIKRFLRGLLKAEKFTAEHPDEALTLVARELKVDRQLLLDIWSDFNFHLSLDQSLLIALEDESRWATKSGLVATGAKMPNYLNFVYPDGLKAIKPAAMRMYR